MDEFEHEARAEAFKRYDGDRIIDENTGEEVSHDDWGYAEMERRAFIAGAEWAAGRRQGPITDEVVEAALDAYAESAGLLRDQRMRAALEAAERARSAVPSPTEQERR